MYFNKQFLNNFVISPTQDKARGTFQYTCTSMQNDAYFTLDGDRFIWIFSKYKIWKNIFLLTS